MNKLRMILFFFILVTVPSTGGESHEGGAAKPAWVGLWEKAKEFEARGSYLEAKEVYEALLKRKAPKARARRSIQKGYEALQIKILFSGIETPDSFFHAIVPGDTLFELAKRYQTTVELLQKSNGLSGDRIYPGKKLKVTRTRFSIHIEKNSNRLTLFSDGKPLKRYQAATGMDGSTPVGDFKIVNKLKDPAWFHGGGMVPPESPENILGSRWLGFDLSGYGIHGTTLPKTIGTQSSKGCVRMFNTDVEEIYALVPVGTSVTIRD